jgi:hypothetical protein
MIIRPMQIPIGGKMRTSIALFKRLESGKGLNHASASAGDFEPELHR